MPDPKHRQSNDADGARIALAERRQLDRHTRGRVIMPRDPEYDRMRKVWNGLADHYPAMIVRCSSVSDVVSAVNFAREHGLPATARGGGHMVSDRAVLDDAMVIDLSNMRGVVVDAKNETVRVEGGARLSDIDEATQDFGFAVPLGLLPGTGIAGIALTGGLGWLTRKYGATIDNVRSIEIVTADGRHLRVSASHYPDLFWALRGGDGGFGVVTMFELAAHPVGPGVWFAWSLYAAKDAGRVLQGLRDFAPTAPEELGMFVSIRSALDDPELPSDVRGKQVVMVMGCYCGPFDHGERAIAPLRELAEPVADLSAPLPYLQVQRVLDSYYPAGRRYYWKSLHLPALDDNCISRMLALAADRPSQHSAMDIWPLGGAVERIKSEDTAFPHRDEPFLISVEANWQSPEDDDRNIGWARTSFDELQRFSTGGSHVAFGGPIDEREEVARRSYASNLERLRLIKKHYDPDNLFQGPIDPDETGRW